MARISSLLRFSTSRCVSVLNQNRGCNNKGLRGGFFLSSMDFFFLTNRPIQRYPLSLLMRQNTGFFPSLHQPLTLKFPLFLWPRGTLPFCCACKLQALAILFMEKHGGLAFGKCHFDQESFVSHVLFSTYT